MAEPVEHSTIEAAFDAADPLGLVRVCEAFCANPYAHRLANADPTTLKWALRDLAHFGERLLTDRARAARSASNTAPAGHTSMGLLTALLNDSALDSQSPQSDLALFRRFAVASGSLPAAPGLTAAEQKIAAIRARLDGLWFSSRPGVALGALAASDAQWIGLARALQPTAAVLASHPHELFDRMMRRDPAASSLAQAAVASALHSPALDRSVRFGVAQGASMLAELWTALADRLGYAHTLVGPKRR
jgi:hypothetical protein